MKDFWHGFVKKCLKKKISIYLPLERKIIISALIILLISAILSKSTLTKTIITAQDTLDHIITFSEDALNFIIESLPYNEVKEHEIKHLLNKVSLQHSLFTNGLDLEPIFIVIDGYSFVIYSAQGEETQNWDGLLDLNCLRTYAEASKQFMLYISDSDPTLLVGKAMTNTSDIKLLLFTVKVAQFNSFINKNHPAYFELKHIGYNNNKFNIASLEESIKYNKIEILMLFFNRCGLCMLVIVLLSSIYLAGTIKERGEYNKAIVELETISFELQTLNKSLQNKKIIAEAVSANIYDSLTFCLEVCRSFMQVVPIHLANKLILIQTIITNIINVKTHINNKTPVDLNNLIKKSIAQFQFKALKQRVKIIFNENKENIKPFASELRLQQVINSIIAKMLDGLEDSGIIEITITCNETEVLLSFKDNGFGYWAEFEDIDASLSFAQLEKLRWSEITTLCKMENIVLNKFFSPQKGTFIQLTVLIKEHVISNGDNNNVVPMF